MLRFVRQEKRKIRLKSRSVNNTSNFHQQSHNNVDNLELSEQKISSPSNIVNKNIRHIKQVYRNQLSSHEINENQTQNLLKNNNVTFSIDDHNNNVNNNNQKSNRQNDQLILYRNHYYRELKMLKKKDDEKENTHIINTINSIDNITEKKDIIIENEKENEKNDFQNIKTKIYHNHQLKHKKDQNIKHHKFHFKKVSNHEHQEKIKSNKNVKKFHIKKSIKNNIK